jgi:O-antigen/teichoic acid export membrane protein
LVANKAESDHTGRKHLIRNVLASWGGHSVFVIAGFVLPRVIDHRIGQDALGIWDFCWSLISYFNLAQLGVGPSVNRYVARHRAEQDAERLNRMVSSAMAVQLVAGLLIFTWTLLSVYFLPTLFPGRFGELLHETRWVVFLLGSGLALEISLNCFANVITGCHRWDIHNAIHAGFYTVTVIGMISSLWLDGGLRCLALASMLGTVCAELTRVVMAYRIYPQLHIRWRYVHWETIREMLVFGGKVILGLLSGLLIYQTTNVLIVAYLGPASLAIYSRAMALVRHCSAFIEKFAFILTPTASSLQVQGQHEELQSFVLESARYCMLMTLPPILFLAILGGPLLALWMGPKYAQGELLMVLALGHLMSIAHTSLWTILRGLNKHGWPAITRVGAAVGVALLTWVTLSWFEPTFIKAALAVTIPLTFIDGVYVAWYATRELGISRRQFIKQVWGIPLLCVLPFIGILISVRVIFQEQPVESLIVGIIGGGIAIAVVYWYWIIPQPMQEKIRHMSLSFSRRTVTT